MRATRPCPVCGFINTKDAERCLKCNAALAEHDISDLLRRRKRPGAFLDRFGNLLARLSGWIRLRSERAAGLGDLAAEPGAESFPRYYRSPWRAGWLSLLPGAGCLYNRQPARAVGIGAIYGALLVINALTLRKPYSNWLLILLLIWMGIQFTEAVATAARNNGQLWSRRNSLALYSLLVFLFGVVTFLGPLALHPFFKFVRIRDEVLEPSLSAGDHVLVSSVTYWVRKPRRGEIVYYDPPMYQMEQPGEFESTTYVINEDNTFERVNALEGDIVDRKDGGPIYLNGAPMPKEYYPLVPEGLPGSFHIEVPRGRYCVLISHYAKESFLATGSFGGISPPPSSPGYVLIGWDDACLVTTQEMYGHAILVYNPPPHRRFLTRGHSSK